MQEALQEICRYAEKSELLKKFIELPLGSGDVNFPEYLKALEDIGYSGYLTIEREAGSDRIKDITEGVDFLKGVIK
ncbi:hypothetical protein ES708_26460 [subsurface metagenome]